MGVPMKIYYISVLWVSGQLQKEQSMTCNVYEDVDGITVTHDVTLKIVNVSAEPV